MPQAFTIDRNNDRPIFSQVYDGLRASIASGAIGVGTRLPSVRALAQELGVNSMTVAKAYRELANAGMVAGRGALGTFVTASQSNGDNVVRSGEAAGAEPSRPVLTAVIDHDYADTFRRMLDITTLPGVISMTQAYPDGVAIDTGPFEDAIRGVLNEKPDALYSYSAPDGLYGLRQAFAGMMAGVGCSGARADELVVTNGGQQALNLVIRSLVNAGDTVIAERPSFFGAIDLFRSMGAKMVGVDMQSDGPDVEQLEKAVQLHRPKLIFLMPTFHNPTGTTTSLEKRQRILEISRRYGVAILEDDHCPEIRFGGDPIPPLKALGERDDQIFYVRGMGKAYIPGIRLGFVAAPPAHIDALVTQKAMADLHTSPLVQESFTRYLGVPAASANLERLAQRYATIQSTVMSLLERQLPDDCTFSRPLGGFNIWIDLPEGTDSVDFCWTAARHGAGVLMGTPLYPDHPNRSTIRLSYGISDLDVLSTGVERLCLAMRDLGVRRPRAARVVV